jgi:hypothetical protein
VVSACGGLPGAGVDCDEFRFDRATWGVSPGDDDDTPTPRQRIADVLTECRSLEGLGRKQVLRMLRSPNARAASGPGDAWVLGPERGYGVDNESLEVRYDARGRVREVEIVNE